MSKEATVAEAEAQVVEENVEITIDDSSDSKPVQQSLELGDEPEVQVQESESAEEELDNYSKGVQKRIKKLTEKYRYAERDKEEASRLAGELKRENEDLKNRLNNLDQGYLNEYGTRIESQLDTAKRAFKEAHERGDAEAMVEAQRALSKITIEEERFRLAKQNQDQKAAVTAEQPSAPVQNQPVAADPKAEKWAERNPWFGEDEIMTQAAFVIHNNLRTEGFDGTEDEYYTQMDSRMKERFPNELNERQNGGSTRVASADTSASRSNKQGRRTVKLTPSQVTIAKKLGVPLEEYAKYVKD
jgi:hypothetical protein